MNFVKDCHNPKFVQVGNRRIYLCGWRDCYTKELKKISKLDIFIALDTSWTELLPISYAASTELIQSLTEFNHDGLSNLIIWRIPDGHIDTDIANEVYRLLQKYNIGFGCLGGHGRTGWLLGYLINKIERLCGDKLLHEVRDRWCDEAIESSIQFKSLGIRMPQEEKKFTWLANVDCLSHLNSDMT